MYQIFDSTVNPTYVNKKKTLDIYVANNIQC